jgi:hypothetical protein
MTIPGTNLLEPQEVHGRYYNVDRLAPTDLFYRRTLNPAEDQRPTVDRPLPRRLECLWRRSARRHDDPQPAFAQPEPARSAHRYLW